MKTNRNSPCPCGSGKKYKHCCISGAAKQMAQLLDEIDKVVAMNPNLSIDELNVIAKNLVQKRNSRPATDFCGLSATQMQNWLYAPFNELNGIKINTPNDLSSCPVMRYLKLILDEAMQQGGSFKATSKGNLPIKLIKQAIDLLPEFTVSQQHSDFTGYNEDSFRALHYARILAELTSIIYRRNGCYHVKKAAQKQYQTQGINSFFLPMLEIAVTRYNWGYLDSWEYDPQLSIFWVFMLWRLQSHRSIDQLTKETCTAFPILLSEFMPQEHAAFSPTYLLSLLITSRFIERFLQFWGFATYDYKRLSVVENDKVDIQPLFAQTFVFDTKLSSR